MANKKPATDLTPEEKAAQAEAEETRLAQTEAEEKAAEDDDSDYPPDRIGVQVFEDYTGKPSKERIITAGLYTSDDPLLMGAGEYLVGKGFARYVGLSEQQYQGMVAARSPKKANRATRSPGLPDGLRGHVEPTERLHGLNTHIQNRDIADVTDEAYQGMVTDEDGEPGALQSRVPPETEPLPQNSPRVRRPRT